MPEESRTDAIEKFLTEQKSMEDRKQALIDDLLKQREAAIAAFDEKLSKRSFSSYYIWKHKVRTKGEFYAI